MEDAYSIIGGNKLIGKVNLSGAKNIALKVLIAALLFDSKVVLKNIPQIEDIVELIHLLKLLGIDVSFVENTVTIDSSSLSPNQVDMLHASKIRVSFLLFAPLLYRFGKASIPNPGGCRLGARSIDRIILGLEALGIEIVYDSETGYYNAKMSKKPNGKFSFVKSSHTGTEMMIMMSVFCEGSVVIENSAQEPEVDDLISFLNEGGANIFRSGKSIVVKGVKKLVQKKPFRISSDRVEAATYATLAIASGGDITISQIPDHFIENFVTTLESMGAGVERISSGVWRFFGGMKLIPVNIETAPFPGFLTDWQPLLAVIMTQAAGESVIHERIFESRFSYVSELRRLGAIIDYVDYQVVDHDSHYDFQYDPTKVYNQTIQITGPQKIHGGVMTVSDLRAGATLAIAALIAQGTSYVKGVHHIERGYEDFVKKVCQLGGDIKKI